MKRNWRIFIGLWLMGLLNNTPYVVFLSAAEDLMPGQAGAILAADIIPTMLAKGGAPFWVHLLSYRAKILLCAALTGVSFYLTAWAKVTWLRLLGVCFTSFAAGLGELTFLGLLSFYPSSQVVAWSSGTGAAGLAGAGYYMTLKLLGVASRTILFWGGVFSVAYAVVYLLVLPAPLPGDQDDVADASAQLDMRSIDTDSVIVPTAQGASLATREQASASDVPAEQSLLGAAQLSTADSHEAEGEASEIPEDPFQLPWRTKLRVVRPLVWPYMLPMGLVYFAEYTITTGVNSTQHFPDMAAKRFYVIASFMYQLGVFISRSSGNVLPINRLWPIALGQLATLAVFFSQGWVRWAQSGALWLVATVWVGLLGGALYVNAFRLIRAKSAPNMREFFLSVASVADTTGIVLASFVSLALEKAINQHHE